MGILKPTFLEIKILKIWLLFSNVMFIYYYLISFNIPTIGYTAIDRIYTAVIQYYGLAASSNISQSDPIYSVAVSLKQDITASSYLVQWRCYLGRNAYRRRHSSVQFSRYTCNWEMKYLYKIIFLDVYN